MALTAAHAFVPTDGKPRSAITKSVGKYAAKFAYGHAGGASGHKQYTPPASLNQAVERNFVCPAPGCEAAYPSASGLYQFIRSTWIGEGGKWGPTLRPAFGGLRPSEAEQLARAKSFTAKNAAYLRSRGVPINKATLYAAHFLGPVTAGAILAAPLTARADTLAGAAATKANPSILSGKTVGDFVDWLERKTGDRAK